jgi:protein-L-isoaspartate(D-aspartate) O-methyltransferase
MTNDSYVKKRQQMVNEQIIHRGIDEKNVIEAFLKVPRHLFVPFMYKLFAYEDQPLSIGYGQTISQPYIVACMTQALNLKSDERVLEIGTGSGYQTAILAELAKKVYTVERIEKLNHNAKIILDNLGYTNIYYKIGDGYQGWKQNAPYDAILVGASPLEVPKNLIDQLKDGGRIILPLGDYYSQALVLITKNGKTLEKVRLCYCQFVEMIAD